MAWDVNNCVIVCAGVCICFDSNVSSRCIRDQVECTYSPKKKAGPVPRRQVLAAAAVAAASAATASATPADGAGGSTAGASDPSGGGGCGMSSVSSAPQSPAVPRTGRAGWVGSHVPAPPVPPVPAPTFPAFAPSYLAHGSGKSTGMANGIGMSHVINGGVLTPHQPHIRGESGGNVWAGSGADSSGGRPLPERDLPGGSSGGGGGGGGTPSAYWEQANAFAGAAGAGAGSALKMGIAAAFRAVSGHCNCIIVLVLWSVPLQLYMLW